MPFTFAAGALLVLLHYLLDVQATRHVAALLGVSLMLSFPVDFASITLFDRPRAFIPPPYRHFAGRGTEWIRRVRDRPQN